LHCKVCNKGFTDLLSWYTNKLLISRGGLADLHVPQVEEHKIRSIM
jgi:hypothetical protein